MARTMLEKETNIHDIIKQHRYFKLALKRLLPRTVRKQLKKKIKFRIVNPDSQDETTTPAAKTKKKLLHDDITIPVDDSQREFIDLGHQ